MRDRPLIGFVVLIVLAVGVAAYTGTRRPHPDPLPSEQPTETPQTPPGAKAPTPTKPKTPDTSDTTPPPTFSADAAGRAAEFDKYKEGAVHVTMEIEGKGKIVMELYPKAAPKTVEHFTALVKQHFYDGTLFHRVVAGFVAQGGDPESKKIDPATIKGLSAEEVGSKTGLGTHGSTLGTVPLEVKLPHIAYGIGEARSQSPDSGDSQFYFNLADLPSLDGQYCVFGRVIDGQGVVDKLEIGDRITSASVN